MSAETVALARRWFEDVWNQKRNDTLEEMLSPECSGFLEGHGDVAGPGAFKAVRAKFLEAFPDLRLEVEDAIADGSKVVVRWRASATHRGDALGLPATSASCGFRGLTWLEFEDGKIVRGWDGWDVGGLMQKLQSTTTSHA